KVDGQLVRRFPGLGKIFHGDYPSDPDVKLLEVRPRSHGAPLASPPTRPLPARNALCRSARPADCPFPSVTGANVPAGSRLEAAGHGADAFEKSDVDKGKQLWYSWTTSRSGMVLSVRRSMFLQEGTVKWFNAEKGYGLIQHDKDQSDAFVDYSAISAGRTRTREEGQRVTIEIVQGQKGPQAGNVTVIGSNRITDTTLKPKGPAPSRPFS